LSSPNVRLLSASGQLASRATRTAHPVQDHSMKHSFRAAVLLSLTCLFFTAVPQKSVAAAQVDDPFLCLEEIEEPRALAWARAENDKTLGMLQSDPRNRRFYEEARSILP